jgi:hypothetical protein
MDRAIQLTFHLLLTLLIKLPIIGFFFGKKKRQPAVLTALMINLVSWIIGTMIWLKNPDVNQLYVRIGTSVLEAIAYWFFLGRNWKKAILMAAVTNLLSYIATQYITLPEGFFQKKSNMIR